MIKYEASFTIDFGAIGHRGREEPFRVRINSDRLQRLINDAERGARLYELSMIKRPGDIWQYLLVELVEAPKPVRERYNYRWAKVQKSSEHRPHPWPENSIPLLEFDDFFIGGWDCEPEDECWLGHRDSKSFHSIADQLLLQVRTAQQRLSWGDALREFEFAMINTGGHPFDYAPSSRWLAGRRLREIDPPSLPPGFYKKLATLLDDQSILSVAWRGNGDYDLTRLLCRIQRERANRLKRKATHALTICALANSTYDVGAWGAEVTFFDEGIGYGDLYIEQDCLGMELKQLIETDHRSPGRYVLSAADAPDIEGFAKEAGEGWTLFTRSQPFDYRTSLRATYGYFRDSVKAVLGFNKGNTSIYVYSHERLVFFIGTEFSEENSRALATQIVRLERKGVDITVVAPNTLDEFAAEGCRKCRYRRIPDDKSGLRDFRGPALQHLEAADVLFLVETDESVESAIKTALSNHQEERPPTYLVALRSGGTSLTPSADFVVADEPSTWLSKMIIEK